MKLSVVSILDALIPLRIKEFEKTEELHRARALVFLELLVTVFAALGLLGCLAALYVSNSPSMLVHKMTFALIACIPGYALSLWIFRRTGNHDISGNLFAAIFYITLVTGAATISGQELIGCILYLLALPLLATLIANYVSGIVWTLMVALAPVLLNTFGNANLGEFFLLNWVALCLGLFLAIYISHNYLRRLSQRLNFQCTWLEFAAAHDPLTGLANRAAFEMRLNESIEACKTYGTKTVLVYIDLDKFKPVNDNYGHRAGDIVLTAVADRLRQLVRRSDTVARLGGDEFAIIFDQCVPETVRPLIERIGAVVRDPISVLGNSLSIGCSVGVVVCPEDGLHADQLAQKADERMYAEKRRNSSQPCPAIALFAAPKSA